MKKFPKSIKWLPLFLLSWLGISQTIYLLVFQPGFQISIKRLGLSFLLGFTAVVLAAALVWRDKLHQKTWTILFLLAGIFGLIFCFVFPLPPNYLLASKTKLEVIYNNPTAEMQLVRIHWLNNGVTDIRYQDLTLSDGSYTSEDGVFLIAQANGSASLNWFDRAWEQIYIEIADPFDGVLTINLNGQPFSYTYPQIAGSDGFLALDVKFPVQKIFTLLGTGVGIYFALLVLLLLGKHAANWLLTKGDGVLKKINAWVKPEWSLTLIIIFCVMMIGLWIYTSFFNRYYADDYCYENWFNTYGWFGASWYAYRTLTGRFIGHLVNFGYVFFKEGIPQAGVISACLGLLLSLIFLWDTLLVKLAAKQRRLFAIVSALIVFVFVYLLMPNLYESLFWANSLMLLSAGFVVYILTTALFMRLFMYKNTPLRLWWYPLFFLLGFISSGFVEASSVVMISLSILFGLGLWIVNRETKDFSGLKLFAVVPLGQILGLIFVLFSAGNMQRLNSLSHGYTFSFFKILEGYFELLGKNTRIIVDHAGFLLLFVVLSAFLLGNSITKPVFPQRKETPLFFKGMMAFLPFVFYAVSFIPSAFISGYFPTRTLFVPIFSLVLGLFLLFFVLGNQTEPIPGLNRIIPVVLVAAAVLIMWNPMLDLTRQMRQFSAEWDAREAFILEAVEHGTTQLEIYPYPHSFGTDLDNQVSDWLDRCLDEYYGIDLYMQKAEGF